MKEPVVIIAKIRAKIGCGDTLLGELIRLVDSTRKEPGNICYELNQDNADPHFFVMYEIWNDQKSIEEHINSIHFNTFKKESEPYLASLEVHEMRKVK